jgi:hypothetical protein
LFKDMVVDQPHPNVHRLAEHTQGTTGE